MTAGTTKVSVDKAKGTLLSLDMGGDEKADAWRENFMRAPTDNDLGGGPMGFAAAWEAVGLADLDVVAQNLQLDFPHEKGARWRSSERFDNGNQNVATVETSYSLDGTGRLSVEKQVRVSAEMASLPRVGLRLRLPESFSQLKWFGRGPHENYSDRKLSAHMGVWQSTVSDQVTPYVFPSEMGGKEDVRWLEIVNEAGKGLRVEGLPAFHFSALPYSQENLSAATHTNELQASGFTELCLDGYHMGVGGDDSWSPRVHEAYRLTPGTYRYGFVISSL